MGTCSRRHFLGLTTTLLVAGCAGVDNGPPVTTTVPVAPSGQARKTLSVVAHQDDDLLFQSPDLLHCIQAGRSVRTVYATAGDAGANQAYWTGRESGVQAAYAKMAAVANSWSTADAGMPGRAMTVHTLRDAPSVSLIFLRLPDGNIDGSGFPSTDQQTLQKLYRGDISTIAPVDGSPSYTKAQLADVLLFLMNDYQPDSIVTLDEVGVYGDGDHSDHHTVAYLTQQAHVRYARPHGFRGYQGYGITTRQANVAEADAKAKLAVFFTYEKFDHKICPSELACDNQQYDPWFRRQYTVGTPIPVP